MLRHPLGHILSYLNLYDKLAFARTSRANLYIVMRYLGMADRGPAITYLRIKMREYRCTQCGWLSESVSGGRCGTCVKCTVCRRHLYYIFILTRLGTNVCVSCAHEYKCFLCKGCFRIGQIAHCYPRELFFACYTCKQAIDQVRRICDSIRQN